MPVQWLADSPDWLQNPYRACWEALIRHTLRRHGHSVEDVDLTLYLTDRETMRAYHRRFRGLDTDTDVLAFPVHERDVDTGRLYLGEVLVCVPVAQDQALGLGHGLEAEIGLLVVHGVLHLLGYEDETPEARRRMFQQQRRILAEEDCLPPFHPPEA